MAKLLTVAVLFTFLSGIAIADEADDLAKEISSELRAAERKMMGGQKDEAAEMWLAIREKLQRLEELNSRHRQLRSLQSKHGKLQRDLEKRLGRSIEPGAEEKLPFVLTSRLGQMKSSITGAEEALAGDEPDVSQARMGLANAERFLDGIEKDFPDEVAKGIEEVEAARKRMEELKARIEKLEADAAGAAAAAGEAEAKREAQSEEWLKKFEPFFPGSYPNKRFEGTPPTDPELLEKLTANWEEAKALLAEYDAAEFPHGKNYRLEQKAEELREMVEEFPKACREALAKRVESRTREFLEKVEWFKTPAQQKWRESEKEKPTTMSDKQMAGFKAAIDEAAEILGADDPKVAELRETFAAFEKENEERKQVAAERTFMLPDRWKSEGREEIEGKAREIVAKEYPKAKILRISLPRTDWSDEVETDPRLPASHPQKVKYIRCILTQVAVKEGDKVWLLGVWVGKIRYSEDVPWGDLHGNTTYREWMMEENLKQD
jgi:hypothetical protein